MVFLIPADNSSANRLFSKFTQLGQCDNKLGTNNINAIIFGVDAGFKWGILFYLLVELYSAGNTVKIHGTLYMTCNKIWCQFKEFFQTERNFNMPTLKKITGQHIKTIDVLFEIKEYSCMCLAIRRLSLNTVAVLYLT